MRIISVISFFLIGIFTFSLNSFAANRVAKSCSYTDVSSAIASAAVGDTVNVPSGNCTWTKKLLIDKGISLIGGYGGGVTKITAGLGPGNFIIQINPADYSVDDPIRLSGFTLDANNNGSILALGQYDKRPPFKVPTKIRVDHNILQNANLIGGFGIWNYCTLYGVVDNNTITNVAYPIKNDPQALETWNTTPPQNIFVSGSNNYIYYEDNILHMIAYPGSPDGLMAEQQFSGRYAFRYNQIILHAVTYSLFEHHGHQGLGPADSGTMGSGFGVELYGNQVISNGFYATFFKTRGGRSFVLNNSSDGTIGMNAYDGSMSTCAQTFAHEQTIHDNFYWGNRSDGLTGPFAPVSADNTYNVSCAGRDHIPMLGRDVMSDTTSPGVTSGTLANRPTTCTVNQGYWATNQSTTSLSGMVGPNPATPISGTFYKCTASNTWTLFYQPYIYPHPLRAMDKGSTPSLPGVLIAPKNLRLI